MGKWIENNIGNRAPLSIRALATALYAAQVRSQSTSALLNTADKCKVTVESQLCIPPGITAVCCQPDQPSGGVPRTVCIASISNV